METVNNQAYQNAAAEYSGLASGAAGYNNPIAKLGGMDAQYGSQEALLSAKMQNAFNSAEAAKNRNWQEYMSNTANQRAVKDLKEAGFSPLALLGNTSSASASGGSAASSGSSFGGKGSDSGSMLGQIVSTLVLLGISSANLQTKANIARANNAAKLAAKTHSVAKYDKAGQLMSVLKYK